MPKSLKRGAPEPGGGTYTADAATAKNKELVSIQPLRDLAKNFDLDIEILLQEYLELTRHLDDDDEDGEVDAMEDVAQNFATAALKIQNSAGM